MLIFVIGTKAQYIKVAPLVLETARRNLPYRLVYTGQHSETFEDLQRNFGLPDADYVLVTSGEARDRSSFLRWCFSVWRAARQPGLIELYGTASALVIHGDTASTLLGALIGRKYHVPVAHVEAGLRSFSYRHPFPEEAIRVAVSHVSDIHFCPDAQAIENLDRAGIRGERVLTQGNTLIDALRLAEMKSGHISAAELREHPYAVLSVHRQENLFRRRRLSRIIELIPRLAAMLPVRFVLHPVTRKRLEDLGLLGEIERVRQLTTLPRMDFFGFNRLLRGARFVVTDGGSNQEECAALGIPCIVLRRATERPDGLGANAWLCDLDSDKILGIARGQLERTPPVRALPEVSPSAIIAERLAVLCHDAPAG